MIDPVKKEIMKNLFILYWKWDTMPEIPDEEDGFILNSPEHLVFQVYESMKIACLSEYNFRSTIRYTEITCDKDITDNELRYKYRGEIPEDFIKAVGFWGDKERNLPIHNAIDIVGRTIKSPFDKFMMSYVSSDVKESNWDKWLVDYFTVYLALRCADIGGCSGEDKQNFHRMVEIERSRTCKKDFDMSHRDEFSNSKFMFRSEDWS